MQSVAQAAPAGKGKIWAGRIMSGLVIPFLLFDSVLKFIQPAPVAEAFSKLGWP